MNKQCIQCFQELHKMMLELFVWTIETGGKCQGRSTDLWLNFKHDSIDPFVERILPSMFYGTL